jgi:hypothetical protein
MSYTITYETIENCFHIHLRLTSWQYRSTARAAAAAWRTLISTRSGSQNKWVFAWRDIRRFKWIWSQGYTSRILISIRIMHNRLLWDFDDPYHNECLIRSGELKPRHCHRIGFAFYIIHQRSGLTFLKRDIIPNDELNLRYYWYLHELFLRS